MNGSRGSDLTLFRPLLPRIPTTCMNTSLRHGFVLATGLLGATASAQTFTTIVSEDFEDYTPGDNLGGQSGGSFFFNAWFSGLNGDDLVVTGPGLDGTGAKATVNVNNGAAFRIPKAGPFTETIAPGFQFGGDGSTVFVSFTARRIAGGDDQFGGMSLNTQFVGEDLFLGSLFQSGEWGMVSPINGNGGSVPGSSVDVETRLVYRIDYVPGDDLVSLFLNPATPHPDPATTAPDLQITAGDHQWNEIRFSSGSGSDPSNLNGYDFDELIIECQDCDPTPLTVDVPNVSVSAGGFQNLAVSAGAARGGDLYLLLGSASGTVPGTPLGGGLTLPLNADAYTSAILSNPNAPPFGNYFGTLNCDGKALGTLTVPPGTNPNLAGLTIHHAYVLFDSGTLAVDFASNATALNLDS